MKNKDVILMKRNEIIQRMNKAANENDTEAFQAAFNDLCEQIQESVLEEARSLIGQQDSAILASRGVRQLTSKEREYYNAVMEAMRAEDPRQAITNVTVTMPETIIEQVFEDLQQDHPLLAKINFQTFGGAARMLVSTTGYVKAAWGKLTTAITNELTAGFREIDFTVNKLTAFLPVSKDMLDLGAEWMDRYVRAVLTEAFANGLEDGIINGTGKDQPIGMIRNVAADASVVAGVYPEKTKQAVTKLDLETLSPIVATMAKNDRGLTRPVKDLVLIVNPADYYSKVAKASMIMVPGGGYASILPFGIEVIQSAAVTVGAAVLGSAPLYFCGGGIGNSGKISFSDDYHFLEDERVYLIKGYAHGFAVDNNAFEYLNIANLKAAVYKVEQVSAE